MNEEFREKLTAYALGDLEPKKAFQRLTTMRRNFQDQENGNGR